LGYISAAEIVGVSSTTFT